MKKIILAALLCVVLIVLCGCEGGGFGSLRQFGRWIEIDRQSYSGPNGRLVTESLVYEKTTHVVYIYIMRGDGVCVVPYLTRNVYGELTVAVYDPEAMVIMPMEPYYDEYGEEWVSAG